MNGIHDLGGMNGFGAIEPEREEPVFHEKWEGLAFALNSLGVAVIGAYNVDEYRHAVERMDPAHYLSARYYERVLTAVATLLVEKGVITREEIEARVGGHFPLAGPVAGRAAADVLPASNRRFAVGERVRVRDIHPAGHTRVPRYARGRTGVVVFVAPEFSFPDAAAHGQEHRSEPTYHVEFASRDLWPEASATEDSVIVDLWETYLEPA